MSFFYYFLCFMSLYVYLLHEYQSGGDVHVCLAVWIYFDDNVTLAKSTVVLVSSTMVQVSCSVFPLPICNHCSTVRYRREWKHPGSHPPGFSRVSSTRPRHFRRSAFWGRSRRSLAPVEPVRWLQVSYQCQPSENDVSGNSTRNTRSLLWELINICLVRNFYFCIVVD